MNKESIHKWLLGAKLALSELTNPISAADAIQKSETYDIQQVTIKNELLTITKLLIRALRTGSTKVLDMLTVLFAGLSLSEATKAKKVIKHLTIFSTLMLALDSILSFWTALFSTACNNQATTFRDILNTFSFKRNFYSSCFYTIESTGLYNIQVVLDALAANDMLVELHVIDGKISDGATLVDMSLDIGAILTDPLIRYKNIIFIINTDIFGQVMCAYDRSYLSFHHARGIPHNDTKVSAFATQLTSIIAQQFKGHIMKVKEVRYPDLITWDLEKITEPEFYTKEIADKLIEQCKTAIKLKEKLTILCYGSPGVGKSSVVSAVITKLNELAILIDPAEIKAIKDVSKKMDLNAILLMDDIDSLGKDKDYVYQHLFSLLDFGNYNIALLTTNSNELPEALVRSSRIDLRLHFPLPDTVERVEIQDKLGAKFFPGQDVCLDDELTVGFTHADLHSLYKLAAVNGITPLEYLEEFSKQHRAFNSFSGEEGSKFAKK